MGDKLRMRRGPGRKTRLELLVGLWDDKRHGGRTWKVGQHYPHATGRIQLEIVASAPFELENGEHDIPLAGQKKRVFTVGRMES